MKKNPTQILQVGFAVLDWVLGRRKKKVYEQNLSSRARASRILLQSIHDEIEETAPEESYSLTIIRNRIAAIDLITAKTMQNENDQLKNE